MRAASPEELETLIEDAVLLADTAALEELLRPDVVMSGRGWSAGRRDVTRALLGLEYVAGDCCFVVERDVAITVSEERVNVCCRERNGGWRLAATVAVVSANWTS